MQWHRDLARPWARTIVDTTQGTVLRIVSKAPSTVFAMVLPPAPADQEIVVKLVDRFLNSINEKCDGI